ncbi:Pentatricopeptide repeat (PPR) superfamily protein [Euphorbia peplus]|nr:Pentatricopeptide repeat (PPR) superfamily protein [Euphorbia peplus]
MLSIIQALKSRRCRSILFKNPFITPFSPSPTSVNAPIPTPLHHLHLFFYSTTPPISIHQTHLNPTSTSQLVVDSFKDWFKLPRNDPKDLIFQILEGHDEVNDLALTQLGLHLNRSFVLEVLNYGFQNKDILSCLQFFDWAGRQPGYSHGRSAFQAIFKILSKANLTSLILDFLDTTQYCRNLDVPGYYPTLVMGYSLAGKPLVALQMFGRMRFQGVDLDVITYHVLLRSLVDGGCFDAVKEVSKQISVNGFENHATHCILVRSFCKQNRVDEARLYLREVVGLGDAERHGDAVGVLVDALCCEGLFDKAGEVIEEFKELGVVTAPAYGVWLKNLVRDSKLDGALEFLKSKNSSEGYIPEIFDYNRLLCRLLKGNRLKETCDLLLDMIDGGISPNEITMIATLRFFCKVGMVDIALDLYKCRFTTRRSPSFFSYNYLINSMCAEGYTDEAYNMFKNRAEQGYYPTRKTVLVIVDSLCREGKLDTVKELVLVSLKKNVMPCVSIYDKLVSALCKAGKVEESFSIYEELSRTNKVCKRTTYLNLIQEFDKLKRGDIVTRLLIEMQEKGHKANRRQFRAVIRSMFNMPNTERQFLIWLDRQLSKDVSNCDIYNNFIDGAGRAERPDLARQVFELMRKHGVRPNVSSFILVVKSYLGNNRVSDALKFFGELRRSMNIGRRLYSSLIIGLSQSNREDIAIIYLTEMWIKKLVPTDECYDVLVQQLCYKRQYEEVVDLVKHLDRDGRQVTSFLGNTLLFHCLKSGELYDAWIRATQHATSSNLSRLGHLIGIFSSRFRASQQIGNLVQMIKQCFPLDVHTYNMLLRRLVINQIDDAFDLFDGLRQNGFGLDLWSYYILLCGLVRHGKKDEAKRLAEEMISKGFDTTCHIEQLERFRAFMIR